MDQNLKRMEIFKSPRVICNKNTFVQKLYEDRRATKFARKCNEKLNNDQSNSIGNLKAINKIMHKSLNRHIFAAGFVQFLLKFFLMFFFQLQFSHIYKLTRDHFAALELFDVEEFIAIAAIEAGHKIVCSTQVPALLVKGQSHVLVITRTVPVRVISGLTTLAPFNVVEVMAASAVQSSEKEPRRTRAPTAPASNVGG